MTKRLHLLAAACLTGLTSCPAPAPPPPPRFQPRPPYPPEQVEPYGMDDQAPAPPNFSQPPPPPPTATGGYPTATRTANPDQVLSPYEPYNVIDVAGFASGKLVRDPSNQKIFRVP